MIGFRLLPHRERVAAVQPRRGAAEFFLGRAQLARRDVEQAIGADRQPFLELKLLLEPFAPEPERALAPRREIGLEEFDVTPER
jgi:hypothetical protein